MRRGSVDVTNNATTRTFFARPDTKTSVLLNGRQIQVLTPGSVAQSPATVAEEGASARNASRKSRSRAVAKRTFDIIFACCALILLTPLMLSIALLVRMTSAGPILYAQPRIGFRGQSFRCLKFRSMQLDADQRLSVLLDCDIRLREEFQRTFKLRKDPRVTPVGRFLRRTSLDELPQLWNILLGQMSVVGPRPIVAAEAERYGEHLATVLQVRPGLTGRWQVSGRNDLSYEHRVTLDVEYATAYTLWSDLRIVLRTVPLLFPRTRNGAY